MSEPTAHTGDISAREVFVGDVLVALCKDVESAAEIVRRWNAAIPTEAAPPSEGPATISPTDVAVQKLLKDLGYE
jgi:hypothetical protein